MICTGKQLAEIMGGRIAKILSGEVKPPTVLCYKPYDSEWEREFEWVLAKYLPDNFTLRNQVSFCGRYRCDFTITCNKTGRVWVIEYDGKAYHDQAKDSIRDSQILEQHKEVQSITRVDASTGHHHPEITRDILKKIIPECLDPHRPYPHQPDWVKCGNSYTAMIFDDRYDEEAWMECEGVNLRSDAPMVQLSVSSTKADR